jgi:hypothetical protein
MQGCERKRPEPSDRADGDGAVTGQAAGSEPSSKGERPRGRNGLARPFPFFDGPRETIRPSRDRIGPFQSFPAVSVHTLCLDVVLKWFTWMVAEAVLGVLCVLRGENSAAAGTAPVADRSR